MGEKTKISWCDSTFNPWFGCERVSTGCDNCYARGVWARLGLKPGERRRSSAANWKEPLKWNKAGLIDNRRRRVFCGSLMDWLDPMVPVEWLADLLDLIVRTPNLDWLLLTKRPELFKPRMLEVRNYGLRQCGNGSVNAIGGGLAAWFLQGNKQSNVWMGVTAENQEQWDKRVPALLRIPAAKRFVSVEPMLGPINMAYATFNGADSFGSMPGIAWVIVGGESGPKARPCNVELISDGVKQCRAAGVKVFVKQLGSNPVSKGVTYGFATRSYKWDNMDQWPEDLRVQEFPQQENNQ